MSFSAAHEQLLDRVKVPGFQGASNGEVQWSESIAVFAIHILGPGEKVADGMFGTHCTSPMEGRRSRSIWQIWVEAEMFRVGLRGLA